VGKESNKDKTACGKSVLKQLPQFSLRKWVNVCKLCDQYSNE
jgi:hypothetical protein